MTRHHTPKGPPQVLKGLQLTSMVRGLPYRQDHSQAQAIALAATPHPKTPVVGGSPLTSSAANAAASFGPSTAATVEAPPQAAATDVAAADLERQVAAAMAEAERAGYQQGLARARKDAEQELQRHRDALTEEARAERSSRAASLQRAVAAMESSLQRIDAEQSMHRARVTEQAAALAFDALCRLMGSAKATTEMLLPLIEAGLDRWVGAQRPTLRLAPQDLAVLQDELPEATLQTLMARVEAQPDEAVGRMGALIEDDHGGVDIGVETQLRALGLAWQHALSKSSTAETPAERPSNGRTATTGANGSGSLPSDPREAQA